MAVELIKAESTYHLRQKILRPNYTIEHCHYDKDFHLNTIHLGYLDEEGAVKGICTTYVEGMNQALFPHKPGIGWRIRGMAVDKSEQKSGIGYSLIKRLEHELLNRGAKFVWCNARTSALGFYERLGFIAIGLEFDIPTVGPHYVALKTLSKP